MFILFVTMNIKSSGLRHILIYKNCKNVEKKAILNLKQNSRWLNKHVLYEKDTSVWTC